MFFCFVQKFFFGQDELEYLPKSEYFFQQHWESDYFYIFKLNGRSLTKRRVTNTKYTKCHDVTQQ